MNSLRIPTKSIIINADDFGYCEERDASIIELFKQGSITSITCLVNGASIQKSSSHIKMYDSIGIHINLTEGHALLGSKNSLVDDSGQFFGKEGFRKNLININNDDIAQEIRLQMYKFIQLFGFLPDHFDGHQHIHIIPQVAQIISKIMAEEFGIYTTRIPLEHSPLKTIQFTDQQIQFYSNVIELSKQAKIIYQQRKIYSTDHFIGLNYMGKHLQIESIKEELSAIEKGSVELMCHPGFLSTFGDNFNQSDDRVHEWKILRSLQFSSILEELSFEKQSFYNLKRNNYTQNKWNILIYSQSKFSTGNLITLLRIQKLLKSMNYEVYIRPIEGFQLEDPESVKNEVKNLLHQCKKEEIHLVCGINAYRTGIIMKKALRDHNFNIPYIPIISGTDANIFLDNLEQQQLIIEACEKANYIISLSQNTLDKVMNYLPNFDRSCTSVIYQSFMNVSNSHFSFKQQMALPNDSKIILLPAGIRKVKDIDFALEGMFKLLMEFENHYFFIMGPILEQNYYQFLQKRLELLKKQYPFQKDRIQIVKALSHDDYLAFLKNEVDLVLNTSESEGVCGSIIEAFFLKVPVLARKIIGNIEITQNGNIAFLFDDMSEFSKNYEQIFLNNSLKVQKVEKAFQYAVDKFSLEKEKQLYNDTFIKVLSQNYQIFSFNENEFKILINEQVHPIQEQNIELFGLIDFKINQEITILDIACGSGIFGFKVLERIIKQKKKVKKMVFSDYQEESLKNVYTNCILNLQSFQNYVQQFEFILSDMFEFIQNKFTIILGNFPQMPFHSDINKIDRWGKNDGSYYNSIFLKEIRNYLQPEGLAYLLQSSLGNLQHQNIIINEQKLKWAILGQNQRVISKKSLHNIQKSLFDYLLDCKQCNTSQFQEEQDHILMFVQLIQLKQCF